MRPAPWFPLILLLGLPAAAWMTGLLHQATPLREIHGQVHDNHGPLSGARVRCRGEDHVSITDAGGNFHLTCSRNRGSQLSVAREGHLIRTFPADRFPARFLLPRLPAEDNAEYSWVDPGNCLQCHRNIHREWHASAHARSASNRHFLNLYDGSDWHGRHGVGWNLRADNPDGAAVCSACHAPTVAPGDDAFADLRRARGVDRRGVHCDFCHKIADATVDPRGLTFGSFGYKLLRPARGQLFFGPLDDAERAGEAFSYAPVYRDSRYCASCHEGVVFGVPVYTTYSEWLASPARRQGKQCQSCHMAPTGALTNIAPGRGGIERDPRTLAAHRFPGSQANMLRSCLTVSVHFTDLPGGVRTHVEVGADRVGHRVPTGFIDRNILLLVEAFDAAGKPVTLTAGPTLPDVAGADFAGRPGRLYAKRLTGKDGQGPIPFWRPYERLVDTRLAPGCPDRGEFLFSPRVVRVRVRLLYRRFWQEVAEGKRWPDNEITVVDRTVSR
jgi:hypothetical protein